MFCTVALYAQNNKVNINKKSLPLKDLIHEIEQQTNYLFVYSEKEIDLNKVIQVEAKDKPLHKVLEEVFKKSGISYNFNEGYISLQK